MVPRWRSVGRRRLPPSPSADTRKGSAAVNSLGRLEPGICKGSVRSRLMSGSSLGRAAMVGIPLSELPTPKDLPMHILHVRRYDVDLVVTGHRA